MVWDLDSDREFYKPTGHAGYVLGLATDSHCRCAITASWDGTLRVWDVNTSNQLRTLEGHTSIVHEVAISPDGRHVISASGDGTLKLWDLEKRAGKSAP